MERRWSDSPTAPDLSRDCSGNLNMLRSVSRSLGALLIAAAAWGGDLTGIWVGQVPVRNGMQDVAFQFVHNGTKLSGKLYGDYQSSAIRDGVLSGHLITFVVVAQEQAGNQINETRLRFTGTVKDGEIELTRERESSTNAGNGGGVQTRGNTKQTFRLKRLM